MKTSANSTTTSRLNPADAERFDRIRRTIQFGATIKDLAWLVRLVEKLEKQPPAASSQLPVKSKEEPVKRTVNFSFVEVADPGGRFGTKIGIECSACGERFFDPVSAGKNPRMLGSGIPAAIQHAKDVHQSTGGLVGPRKGKAVASHQPPVASKNRQLATGN